MSYVDGYVLPVPKKKIAAYQKIAAKAGKIWRDNGALEYRECVGEDLKTKFGVPFPKQLKVKAGETVVFSWIVFKSKAHRNSVNAKVMKDKRMAEFANVPMPFDCKRICYGGFKILVDA
jgi:uncharacterized protein YbaA (DUF1428 family)